jgi:hypothetical protein
MAKARRKSTRPVPVHTDPSALWERSTEWRWNGRVLTSGTEVSVRGERGRFRFREHVRTPAGAEWLTFVGGPHGQECFRSFRPERVRTVHRVGKSGPALVALHKAATAARGSAA